MRAHEFVSEDQMLDEVSMSPTSLKQMASKINAQAGMEFEMIIPGASQGDEDYEEESEPDYDMDESFPSGRGWRQEVISFFRGDMGNSTSSIQRALDLMGDNYADYQETQFDQYLSNNSNRLDELVREQMTQQDDESDDEFDARVQAEIDEEGSDYERAMDEFRDEFYQEEDYFDNFLRDNDIGTMSDFGNQYNLDWPHWTYPESSGGDVSIDDVATDFSDAIGRPVNASSNYHGGTREAGKYVVEPDSSLEPDNESDGGLEFVSPPLPLDEMLSDLDKVAKWASRAGAYTNDSTGLHMNVSVPNFDQDRLDYVKLAIFLGDEYVLEQFGRAGNTYCKSAMAQIQQTAKTNPDKVQTMLRQMQGNLSAMASKIVHTGQTSKYTSINTKTGYIEFRSPGGDWLGDYAADPGKITNTLLRFVVALDIAMKPELHRQEYMKKLYKTLSPEGSDDTIQFFARYAAGELPTTALKAFVKNAQEKRKRGKEEKEQVDALYKGLTSGSTTFELFRNQDNQVLKTFKADSVEQAREVFRDWLREQGLATGSGYGFRQVTAQIPPNNDRGNYEVYQRATDSHAYRFDAADNAAAWNVGQRWVQQMRVNPAEYSVRPVAAAEPISGSTLDLARQRAAQGTSSLPPGTARWLILDQNDNEIYSFVNTTSQRDANQYATNWLRQNRQGGEGEFTVVPVT